MPCSTLVAHTRNHTWRRRRRDIRSGIEKLNPPIRVAITTAKTNTANKHQQRTTRREKNEFGKKIICGSVRGKFALARILQQLGYSVWISNGEQLICTRLLRRTSDRYTFKMHFIIFVEWYRWNAVVWRIEFETSESVKGLIMCAWNLKCIRSCIINKDERHWCIRPTYHRYLDTRRTFVEFSNYFFFFCPCRWI